MTQSQPSWQGSVEPTYWSASPFEASDGPKIIKLMQVAGIRLDDDQCQIITLMGARTVFGGWTHKTVAQEKPRQNGKTLEVAAFAAGEMVLNGNTVLYTSQLQKTSTETFEEFKRIFDHPSFRPYVAKVNTALGREEVRLKNGARVKFLARTRAGGRGQHADILMMDECQLLDDSQLASFLPAISASKCPMIVYMGTSPDDGDAAEVFTRLRKQGRAHQSSLLWLEYAADTLESCTDESTWVRTNPAITHGRMDIETVRNEFANMALDKFARERCGWWPEKVASADTVISTSAWDATATDHAPESGLVVYSAKFSADGSRVALAVCLRPRDGRLPHVELVDYRPTDEGLGDLARWLDARADRAAQIVVDGLGNAQALIDRLRELGVPKRVIQRPTAMEAAGAYAALLDAVNDGVVTHLREGQRPLDIAATTCTKRRIGNRGGWGFESTEEADACIIEAAALAYRSAMTTKRDPDRSVV